MADPGTLLREVDEERLGEWLRERRWFGAKAADLSHFGVLDVVPLRDDPPPLSLRARRGPLQLRACTTSTSCSSASPRGGRDEQMIGEVDGGGLRRADRPRRGRRARPADAGARPRSTRREGTVDFHWTGALPRAAAASRRVRPMGVEQSNSTIVLDDALALKVFRRAAARATTRSSRCCASCPRTASRTSPPLGRLVRVLRRAHGGDARRAAALRRRRPRRLGVRDRGARSAFLERARRARRGHRAVHSVLASDADGPGLRARGARRRGARAADGDDRRGDRARLPSTCPRTTRRVAPIAGRGEEVRDRLQMLSHQWRGGRLIRHHGDYHLGQTLRRRRAAG